MELEIHGLGEDFGWEVCVCLCVPACENRRLRGRARSFGEAPRQRRLDRVGLDPLDRPELHLRPLGRLKLDLDSSGV